MPPAGRGGAGNYEQSAQAHKLASQDLEAQLEDPDRSNFSSASKAQPFAHTGRGGAGNWYSPNALAETGNFKTGPANIAKDSSAATPSGGLFNGRGGAGNLRETVSPLQTKDVGAEAQLKQEAQKAVEIELSKPEQAHLGGRKLDGKPDFIDVAMA